MYHFFVDFKYLLHLKYRKNFTKEYMYNFTLQFKNDLNYFV